MGGLPCAKTIIDNRNAVVAKLKQMVATYEHASGCMVNTIVLSTGGDEHGNKLFPTEEMEAEFLAATAALAAATKQAIDPALAVCAKISKLCTLPAAHSGG